MNQKLRYSILAADLLWIPAALLFAQLLRTGPRGNDPNVAQFHYFPLVAMAIWIFLYFSKKLEGFCGGWHLPNVFAQVVVGVFYLMGSLLALAFLSKQYYPRLTLFLGGILLSAGFVAIRCLACWLINSRSHGRVKRRVVILGSGRIVRELARKISRHPEMGMEVAGSLFPSDTEASKTASGSSAGALSVRTLNVLNLLQEKRVQEVIVVEPVPPGAETEKLISSCRKAGMRVHLVPQRYELYLSKAKLTEIDDVPLLSLEEQTLSKVGLELKRTVDVLGALFLLVLCAPLLAVVAGMLRRKKGRAFRTEPRCGRNGTPFRIHRLNVDRDPTNLLGYERMLAQLSLTELPQLWNVFKGEMSLVGPRPEAPDRVKHYSMWQRQRLSVIPGLTGLAQVNGLREQHSSEEKAHFDLQYIFHWSLFLDLSLLLQTAWTLFVRLIKEDGLGVVPTIKAAIEGELTMQTAVLDANSAQSSTN
jgi:lipopolysaccharide/colanic/teichoic acid biosynthesis glycosyltransferase